MQLLAATAIGIPLFEAQAANPVVHVFLVEKGGKKSVYHHYQ
jgi:hypothetical protein